jgi:hypothetical protein
LTPADELYQQMKAAFDSEVKSSKHFYWPDGAEANKRLCRLFTNLERISYNDESFSRPKGHSYHHLNGMLHHESDVYFRTGVRLLKDSVTDEDEYCLGIHRTLDFLQCVTLRVVGFPSICDVSY